MAKKRKLESVSIAAPSTSRKRPDISNKKQEEEFFDRHVVKCTLQPFSKFQVVTDEIVQCVHWMSRLMVHTSHVMSMMIVEKQGSLPLRTNEHSDGGVNATGGSPPKFVWSVQQGHAHPRQLRYGYGTKRYRLGHPQLLWTIRGPNGSRSRFVARWLPYRMEGESVGSNGQAVFHRPHDTHPDEPVHLRHAIHEVSDQD